MPSNELNWGENEQDTILLSSCVIPREQTMVHVPHAGDTDKMNL